MAVLTDKQFELNGVVWGLFAPIEVDADGFDTGTLTLTGPDASYAREDALWFGEDSIEPATWSWDLFVNQQDEQAALEHLSAIRAAWRNDTVRRVAGEVCALRYHLGGRTRVVYGRPRRFTAPLDNRLMSGYVAITADFRRVDDRHYGDEETSAQLNVTPSSAGGFVAPFVTPLTTISSGAPRQGQVFVEGDMPTWAIVEFAGPGTDFELTATSDTATWKIDTTGTLAADAKLTIDPRPWRRSALRTGGAGTAEITRRTFMADLLLQPGWNQLSYRGVDATGTATCTVRWRPAYRSL